MQSFLRDIRTLDQDSSKTSRLKPWAAARPLFGRAAKTLVMVALAGGAPLLFLAPANAADVVFDFKVQADGTAPFDANNNPGNDASDTNLIVRTQDIITYKWEYAVNNGDASNVVLRATVPPEQEVSTLPTVCQTGSTLTVDGAGNQSIICLLGTVVSGSSGSIELKTRVLGQRRSPVGTFVGNGQLTQATGSLTADGVGTVAPVTTPDLTISATPKVDLVKDSAFVSGVVKGSDGITDGLLIRYPITMVISGGGKGSEALAGDINFTDQLLTRVGSSDGPAVAGARLYTWATNGVRGCNWMGGSTSSTLNAYPYGKVGTPAAATTTNSVTDSGVWSCSQANPGDPIQLTISGADTTGNRAPTLSLNGSTLAANKTFLVSGTVHLWVPVSEIVAAGGQLDVRNKLSALTVNGVSSQPNVEPTLTNNQYDHTLVGISGNFDSYYSRSVDARGSVLLPMSAIKGGDGVVMPTQGYAERVQLSNNGGFSWNPGAILCTAIDNQTQTVVPLTTDPSSAVRNFSSSGLGTKYVIEYGTGDYATVDAQKSASCRDQDSPDGWFSDIRTVPGGLDAITKVRVKALQAIPPTDAWDIAVNLSARNTYRGTTNQVPAGTLLTEYSSYYIEGLTTGDAGMPAGWRGNRYNQVTHTSVSWGDRLTLTRAIVRIDKQNVPNNPTIAAQAGTEVTFNLLPTVTAPVNPAPVSPTVILQDILPATMDYVPGSANLPPTSIVINPDQTETLTWDLGTRTPNQALPTITFRAAIRPDAPNNATAINTAIISSPDDGSLLSARTDTATVNIGNAAAFRIFKEVDTLLLNPNQAIGYTLSYANTGSSDVGTSQFIDVLPYIGDGRIPNTTYTGTLAYSSITGSNGETFEFTNRAFGSINVDPNHASNQSGGATQWCSAVQFGTAGCPSSNSEVTAIRITAPAYPKATPTRSLRLILQPTANAENSLYTNNFTGRGSGLLGLLQSNDVYSRVKTRANVVLVKRITAIGGTPITTVVDDATTTADNASAWPANYLKGAINGGAVKPGDAIEYTIYWLNQGEMDANGVRVCDRLQPNQIFQPNGYGVGTGVQVQMGTSSVINLTNANDSSDRTQFIAAGGAVPTNCNITAANTDGTLVVDITGAAATGNPALVTMPGATAAGSPNDSYGFFRFITQVNP